MLPANHRVGIGVVEIGNRLALLGKDRARIAADTRAAFFKHHVTFGGNDRFGEDEVAHPVRLHLHHKFQTVGCDALKIGGVVRRGERVVRAAIRRDNLRKFTFFQIIRAFEKQMFEKMRQTRFARRIVRGTNLVPDHIGHHGGAVIDKYDALQAIFQCEPVDVGLLGQRRCCHKGGTGKRQAKSGGFEGTNPESKDHSTGGGGKPEVRNPRARRRCASSSASKIISV